MRVLLLIVISQILFLLPAQSMEFVGESESIHSAAYQGNLDRVQELLNSGVDASSIENWSGYTPLHYAVYSNHLEISKLLVQQGASFEDFGRSAVAPVHLAASSNALKITEFLITLGTSLEIKDKAYRYTPIFRAVKNGHLEMVKLLLENGASIDSINLEDNESIFENHITPIDLAAQEGHLEIVYYPKLCS